jgi:hypothetical protein
MKPRQKIVKNVIKILCGCVLFPGVDVDIDTLQYYFLNRTIVK